MFRRCFERLGKNQARRCVDGLRAFALCGRALVTAISVTAMSITAVVTAGFGLLAEDAHAKPAPMFDPTDTRPVPKVSILTMGPGDQAFFKFGHNAIR